MYRDQSDGWIGVDLDGTLAKYTEFKGETVIGDPVPLMVTRVQKWLRLGIEVRILTARVYLDHENIFSARSARVAQIRNAIEEWCFKHIGKKLEVTDKKDPKMIELWDDRVVQVIPNTGIRADRKP
jgi:hypothetical protein